MKTNYKWFVVAMLWFVCFFNYADRQAIFSVFEPIKGEIPSPLAPPAGCHFHPRCPHAMAKCMTAAPPLNKIASGRLSACYLNDEL